MNDSGRTIWTNNEKNKLRKYYPNKGAEYCSKKLNRSCYAIRRMANILKIYTNTIRAKYEEKNMRLLVAESKSISEVLRKLGVRKSDKTVKKYIDKYGLDTSHFWNKSINGGVKRGKPLSEILVKDNFTAHGSGVKERLYREGMKERKCELCGQGEMWKGRRMSLILDHKNGIHSDWRPENLRIVCPNCGATLDTHCRGTRPRKVKKPDGRKVKGKLRVGNRKVKTRPSLKQLTNDVMTMSYLAVGKKYGVSDNAIRKWFKSYGVIPPKKIKV